MSVHFTKLKLNGTLLDTLSRRFIAFDTETTGLDPWYNRIIEVGAVCFENGKPVGHYGSLMHSVNYVPYEASMVNHITSDMVRNAPDPAKVYADLISFFGDVMQGGTVLVGHNATFDMKFLANELERRGISADLLYADTCALSRTALPMLYDHRQDTVASSLGITNRCSHRAETDAETCGEIMVRMIPLLASQDKVTQDVEKRADKRTKFEPVGPGRAFCQAMTARAQELQMDCPYLCFQRAGKLIHVRSVEPLFAVCLEGRHPYILARRQHLSRMMETDPFDDVEAMKPCTAGESKLYGDAARLFVGEDMQRRAECLLTCTLEENALRVDKLLCDAETRWNHGREMELYWRPDELADDNV